MSAEQVVVVHISDLHIGCLVNSHSVGLISGFRPHDIRLCESLVESIRSIRSDESPLKVPTGVPLHFCVSGDLTSIGDVNEYPISQTFLQGTWSRGHSLHNLGLAIPLSRLFTVAGNHDHWKGSWLRYLGRPPAYDAGLYRPPEQFRPSPWIHQIQSSSGKIRVELLGIDSNAGLAGRGTNLRAQGRFDSKEFAALKSKLQSSDKQLGQTRPVRIVMSHHGLSSEHEDPKVPSAQALEYNPKLSEARQLESGARQSLLDLAGEYRIDLLLTGHLHNFFWRDHVVQVPQNHHLHKLWEIRCPTSTQGPRTQDDEEIADDRWRYRQGYWIHQIVWDAARHQRIWKLWGVAYRQGEFVMTTEPLAQSTV